MNKFCAYYEPGQGVIRFKSTLQASAEPPAVDGLSIYVSASDFDVAAHRVVNGALVPATSVQPTDADMQVARMRRNSAIAACDWTQLPDTGLTEAQCAAWGAYRQALRDLPQQPGFPAVAWPSAPR